MRSKQLLITALLVSVLGALPQRLPAQSATYSQGGPPSVRTATAPKVFTVADVNDLVFARLVTRNSLSQLRVAQIVEDDQGFIWFGTQSGLNRYDGYEYKVFAHDPRRPDSLSGVYIYSLFKDRSGALWVGNDAALDRFDPAAGTFTHFHLDREDGSGLPVTVFHISQDARGMLWLATGYGLYGLDPISGHRVHFVRSARDPFSLTSNNIKFTGEDRQGSFWVVNDAGLDQFDRNSGRITLHVPLPEAREMSFVEDDQGNFWIPHASGTGLALLDRHDNSVIPISFARADGSGGSVVTSLCGALRARDGSIWFASSGAGLLKLDREQGRLLRYRHRAGDGQSLLADNVTALFEDRDNHIWVGLHAAPPNFFSLSNAGFKKLPYAPMPPRTMGMVNMVNSIYEAHDGSLWISYIGMLARVAPDRRQVTYFGAQERGRADDVVATVEDASGRIWFGTVGAGLGRFDSTTGRFTWSRHDPTDQSSLSNDVVTRLFVDHTGRLWAATWDGLDLVEPGRNGFRTFRADTEVDAQKYIAITEDGQGLLWLASLYSGLHRFDPATGQFIIYRHDEAKKNTLSNNRVNSVYADEAGIIWAGTQAGLSRLDPATGVFTNWTERDGLPGNVVSCILEDEDGQLWMSTNRGLAQFQPDRGRFRVFTVADGLPGDDLTGWATCFRSPSGEMFFGGFGGATAFHPSQIVERTYAPHVVLTTFEIAGVPASVGRGSPLTRTIGFTDQLTLSPDQNNFAVGFTALSFGSPATNRYRYILEGLDRQWQEVSADRRLAVYTTLPAGHYTFRVMGSTARGPWSEPGVALSITILPYWWATWWFRTLLGVCCVLLVAALYWVRVRQIAGKFEVRMDERGRIARELHDSLLQGFQGLMLCIQAVRDLLPDRPTEAAAALETVLERGDKAIAEGRDTVYDLRTVLFAETDLADTVKSLVAEMSAGDTSRHTPACRVLVEGRVRALDPAVRDEVYRIIREALRNAFQHARAKSVEADINYGDRHLVIRVRDDGIGIDPLVLKRGKREGHWGLPGMRERAESFGGRLTVWSEFAAGTEVELNIPASVAYLRGRRHR